MKLRDPFICDKCSTQKKETNHWFIGWTSASTPIAENKKGVCARSPAILVIPWNEKMKDRAGVKHLCGSRCVTAFVAEAVAEMVSPPKIITGAVVASGSSATIEAASTISTSTNLSDLITKDENGNEIGPP